MSSKEPAGHLADDEHLSVLGYEGKFDRSMSLWANFALGFTYLSPLVGVYSLLAVALATGGPPSIWWIVIVAIPVSYTHLDVYKRQATAGDLPAAAPGP